MYSLIMYRLEEIVVILGCAHAGVINTLDYIAQLANTNKFYAVIGGMHLLQANQERLQATLETLTQYDVQIGSDGVSLN